MSIESAKVLVPPPVATPRGAEWAAALFEGLARLGHSLWRGLEAVGHARAQRELKRLGVPYAPRPEIAQTLGEAMHRAAMHRDSQH